MHTAFAQIDEVVYWRSLGGGVSAGRRGGGARRWARRPRSREEGTGDRGGGGGGGGLRPNRYMVQINAHPRLRSLGFNPFRNSRLNCSDFLMDNPGP